MEILSLSKRVELNVNNKDLPMLEYNMVDSVSVITIMDRMDKLITVINLVVMILPKFVGEAGLILYSLQIGSMLVVIEIKVLEI